MSLLFATTVFSASRSSGILNSFFISTMNAFDSAFVLMPFQIFSMFNPEMSLIFVKRSLSFKLSSMR